MKLLLSTAAIAAMVFVPASASAQFLGLDTNTVFSGTAGAGLGGVIGHQIAGSGNRTEGAAIGALVGGLAGSAYGNSQSSYGGNPYAGQFNPGFNGGNLAGTAVGAGLGGVLGSNLAGSGQREEGTAIGAVLGGAAGYALANGRSNSRYQSGPVQGYGDQGYGAAPTNYGAPMGYTYGSPAGFGNASALPPQPLPSAPHYMNGGMVAGPILSRTTYHPQVTQTVVRQRTIQMEPKIIHQAPVVMNQPCPSGTTEQHDGTCLSAPRTVHAPAPTVIPAYCPSGTTDMGDGTCQEPARTVMGAAPIVIAQSCPSGTTDMGDGTCQEPARTIMGAAPIVIAQSCPSGTTDMGDGTCQEPARTVMGAAPIVITQACPSGTLDLGNGTCEAPARIIEAAPIYTPARPYNPEPVYTQPNTTVSGGQYCYGNGKSVYDHNGRKIKGSYHNGSECHSQH